MLRRLWGLAGVAGLMTACLMLPGQQQAYAAAGDPFPEGPGLVFVAQGPAPGEPTTLYEAVQGTGEVTFVREGAATFGYNAMGFRVADRYLYAINNNDGLARIGQGGVATNTGQVGLPSSGTFSYNQGTFGSGPTADTLYVRLSTTDNSLYAVDVVAHTSRRIALASNVPNLSDIVWKDGYIWGVYGEGRQLYRVDPVSGAVLAVPLTGIPANPYGAQWVYGNGNLGISNNVTGTVYQLHINNQTSGTPTVTVLSSTRGPANNQNDGAAVPGEPADLGITKDGPATWAPGDTISYTLRVHNYGPGASSGYIVTDTLPDNLGNPQTTTPGCAIVTESGQSFVKCTGASLGVGADAPVITITGTAPATIPGTDCAADGISDTAQVTGNESDPDQGNNTDHSTACPAGQAEPSFTVSKSASVGPGGFVGSGDSVTYTVTVTNDGTVDYTADNPATFTDDLSDVTDDAKVDPASLTGGAQLLDGGVSWSGPLAVGESHTVTYTVTVNGPDQGDHVLRNAVIPGPTGSCTSADDCTSTIPVAAFTVTKSVDATAAAPGDVLHYTLTVTNTGAVDFGGTGTPHAPPAHIVDALAGDLTAADYNGDASNGGTLQGTDLVWDLDLPIGATEELTYSLTAHSDITATTVITNTVTPGQYGTCATPDACTTETTIQTRGFTVAKTVSPGAAQPGDRVTYTVTVTNTGTTAFTAADPASFTDDLSGVLDDATYNNDATGGATVTGDTLSWSGPLAVGATATVTYSVTVNDPVTGDQHLRNAVTPGTSGTCATAGSCTTEIPVVVPERGFTVVKSVSPGAAQPGDRVAYTVTVTNTGETAFTDADPASFTDDLSGVLDDATYNNDATGGATVTGNTLSWSGPLAVGATVTVTYSVTVNDPVTGDRHLRNAVTPGASGTCATTGTCTTDVPVTVPTRGFTVAKTVSPRTAEPGDTVTYTVAVTNTGSTAFTDADPATFTDDLSDVLDDATYNNDATGGATVSGNTLSWSGPLAVGATVTVTYSVTVNDPVTGDRHLRNAVTPGTSGTCATTGTCTTDVPVTVVPPADSSLSLTKRAETQGPFEVGDRVTYVYTVTNTGTTPLTDITVADDLVSQVTCDETTLAPGARTTCRGTYTITSDAITDCHRDANAPKGGGHETCSVTNTATATGTDPDGADVTSDPAHATIAVNKEGKPTPPCPEYGECPGYGGGHDRAKATTGSHRA
ncbi:DUF7927 domain-containing protein [Streptomyces laurentii]|uniref:DUF7927 domain-containing protein n=1 Tax=Streptomyces laurentii TaxID=39478 RepID=UPI00367B7ED0